MNLFFVLYIIDILANLKKYKNLVNKKATYVSGFFIKGIWWRWRELNPRPKHSSKDFYRLSHMFTVSPIQPHVAEFEDGLAGGS